MLSALRKSLEKRFSSDELAQRRRELPWVRIEKDYRFETDDGPATLADLFRGRSQLLVYHFMFGPEYTGGCPACSSIADGFNGFAVHLEHHDVAMIAVSRVPIAALQAYKRRMGWTFTWASSRPSTSTTTLTRRSPRSRQRSGNVEYNYGKPGTNFVTTGSGVSSARAPAEFAAMTGTDVPTYTREAPGMSAFVLEDGIVYHTYSTYARGLDVLWGMYQWLDRAPKGRNEPENWLRRRNEYDKR